MAFRFYSLTIQFIESFLALQAKCTQVIIDLLSKRVIFRLDTLVLTCQSLFLMCETALLNLQFILLADALCNFLNADFRIVLPL